MINSKKIIKILLIIIIFIFFIININKNKKCNNIKMSNILKENIYVKMSNILKENIYVKNIKINPNYKKTIIQTYFDKSKIPQKVYNNINEYAPDYKHIIFDDKDCINFLEKYYSKEIVNRFNTLKKGAHKADLFRYCYLYINGGLYLDIKTILIKPVSEIFTNKNFIYSVISASDNKSIYQGIIYTPPHQEIFKVLIYKLVNTSNLKLHLDYLAVTKQFYQSIESEGNNSEKIKVGLNKNKYYLFIEKILDKSHCFNKLDRYNKCSFIFDKNNEKIFKTRYNNFPWL
jgi:mannosyltransferase OCH1-like enzyme